VESEDAAIAWAAKIPNARNGSVEVRRVDEGELADRMASVELAKQQDLPA
jgi:hypothetical protein